MSTIIKTGVILLKQNEPYAHYISNNITPTLYGDLHIVGNCCIVYYPPNQVNWATSHGWIDLTDPHQRNFLREFDPFRILILPAGMVTMRRDALDAYDLAKFVEAGGRTVNTRGEMG